jgi:hypothetical protein
MNQSEKQLSDFLEFKKNYYTIKMTLRPQGDNTIIEKEPINLCEVEIKNNKYTFGGISEKVYDELVVMYDYREQIKN